MYKAVANFATTLHQREIVRFGFVGATSTILDIFILNILGILGLNIYLATGIGFFVGAVNGYILNSALVFQQDRNYRRFTKYVIISTMGLGLTELIIHLVHIEAGLRLNIAKLVAVGVVFFWNYGWSKVWAFK